MLTFTQQANDISANLHNKVSKGKYSYLHSHGHKNNTLVECILATAAEILRDLHLDKQIEARVSGRYHRNM